MLEEYPDDGTCKEREIGIIDLIKRKPDGTSAPSAATARASHARRTIHSLPVWCAVHDARFWYDASG